MHVVSSRVLFWKTTEKIAPDRYEFFFDDSSWEEFTWVGIEWESLNDVVKNGVSDKQKQFKSKVEN